MDKIKLESLNLNELISVRNNVEKDLNSMLDNYNNICLLKTKMNDSKILINNINEKANIGDKMLIPLSSSLYVPGTLQHNDNFLVDIGTGYFAEMNSKKTIEFCDHTESIINENVAKIKKEIEKKRDHCDQINILIQKKYQEALKKQQQNKK